MAPGQTYRREAQLARTRRRIDVTPDMAICNRRSQYPLTLPIWAFCAKYDIDQLGFTPPACLSTDSAGPGQQDPVRLRPEAPRCCTTTAAVCPLQRATDLNAGKAGAVLGGRTRIG